MNSATRIIDHPAYSGQKLYVGDIHNHCGISYGHGSIEDAFANAQLQLDFASVPGHAWWHDMPREAPELADVVAFHEKGFARLAECWGHVQDVTAAAHEDGRFVSMLSFEWHSSMYGDHCVYYKGAYGDLIRADSLEQLRVEMRRRKAKGVEMMALPHHIGYRQGRRGANWSTYTAEFSPVVEMMSMHGCGESDGGPRPYLHTMGPRCWQSSAVHGLSLGHRFGLIGSTDHHSAHPGSFGHGRVAVWAPELTRDGIWTAFWQRRVYALTGDPIVVGFSVNGSPMGSVVKASNVRRIQATVRGQAPLDTVEVVRDGKPIHWVSRSSSMRGAASSAFSGVVGFAVGWGRSGNRTDWDIQLRVDNGRLTDVSPRLRGNDIVAPVANAPDTYRFSSWGRSGEAGVWLRTTTHANPNVVTDATQGLVLHVDGDDRTVFTGTINGIPVQHSLGELRDGSVTGYLAGFVSPAYQFDRAVPDDELTATVDFDDEREAAGWYYLRVRQINDQWAWTSPVWIDGPSAQGAHRWVADEEGEAP